MSSAGYTSQEPIACSNRIALELRGALDGNYVTSTTVESHTTIAELKAMLEEFTQVPRKYQQLVSTGCEVYLDSSAISETGLRSGGVILFVESLPPTTALLDICRGEVDDAILTRYVLSKGVDLQFDEKTMNDSPEEPEEDDASGEEFQETRKTALDFAIERGHTEVGKVLADSDLYTLLNDATDEGGALHTAAYWGRVGICQALLNSERFAQVNTLTSYGWSALHFAVPQCALGEEESHTHTSLEDRYTVCKMLLEHPRFSAMNARDTEGTELSALDKAAYAGHASICKLFLSNRRFTEVGTVDAAGRTPLHQLTARPGQLPAQCVVECCELLLADGRIDVHARDMWDLTALANLRRKGFQDACILFPEEDKETGDED